MKRILLPILFATLPMAAPAAPLSEELRDYVVAFDMDALDREAKAALRDIIDNPDKSHGDKVLDVHTVLSANDALRHVDIHGESLGVPADVQIGMASIN